MNPSKNSTKPGTIWQLGEHRLAFGDCRDKELVARLIGSRKINAIIVDPPYAVDAAASKRGFQALLKDKDIANDHLQSDAEYRAFTKAWIETIATHLAKKNTFYIFNADKMIFALRDGMLDAGLKFCQLLIWVKTHAVIGRMDYAPQHELIAYGWLGTHEFLKTKDKSVLVFPKPNKSPFHPTTKPLGLIRRLVLNSTRIGDVVYDGFLGSGTTLLACEQTKRVCFGIELDEEYCRTIITRFEKISGLTAKKV
jgi:DNA modification methylase